MARKPKKPLTFTLHIGDQQIEKLTEEQLDIMAERLSKAMSLYYSDHPDEYERLCEEDDAGGEQESEEG